jgi:hypothetical protein
VHLEQNHWQAQLFDNVHALLALICTTLQDQALQEESLMPTLMSTSAVVQVVQVHRCL